MRDGDDSLGDLVLEDVNNTTPLYDEAPESQQQPPPQQQQSGGDEQTPGQTHEEQGEENQPESQLGE